MKLSTALERVLCPRIHFKMMIFDHKTGKSSGVILCVRILKFILVGITVKIKVALLACAVLLLSVSMTMKFSLNINIFHILCANLKYNCKISQIIYSTKARKNYVAEKYRKILVQEMLSHNLAYYCA